MQDLLADARQYLSAQFKTDMSDLPADSVRGCIESIYPGGWHAYKADYQRFTGLQSEVRREVMSPIKQKALVQHMTGRRLQEYDEIVSLEKSDLETKIVLKLATVDRRSRRDKITAERVVLYVFTRAEVTHMWSPPEMIEVEMEVDFDHHRWGALNTPERHAAIMEQVETCYRPGTHKSPLPGWIARADMSWKEAHEGETFQRPTRKKENN